MSKINQKLSVKDLTNAKPKTKPYVIHDEGGLRFVVRPNSKVVAQYPYKHKGKTSTYTIGVYSPQTRDG